MGKELRIAERGLTLEEHAGFLAVITLRMDDSVAALREYRDKAAYDEILEELKKRGTNIIP